MSTLGGQFGRTRLKSSLRNFFLSVEPEPIWAKVFGTIDCDDDGVMGPIESHGDWRMEVS